MTAHITPPVQRCHVFLICSRWVFNIIARLKNNSINRAVDMGMIPVSFSKQGQVQLNFKEISDLQQQQARQVVIRTVKQIGYFLIWSVLQQSDKQEYGILNGLIGSHIKITNIPQTIKGSNRQLLTKLRFINPVRTNSLSSPERSVTLENAGTKALGFPMMLT